LLIRLFSDLISFLLIADYRISELIIFLGVDFLDLVDLDVLEFLVLILIGQSRAGWQIRSLRGIQIRSKKKKELAQRAYPQTASVVARGSLTHHAPLPIGDRGPQRAGPTAGIDAPAPAPRSFRSRETTDGLCGRARLDRGSLGRLLLQRVTSPIDQSFLSRSDRGKTIKKKKSARSSTARSPNHRPGSVVERLERAQLPGA
jgi:hypothetical protein